MEVEEFSSSAALHAPAPSKSEVHPLASWVKTERVGRIERPTDLATRSTIPAIALDLLQAIQVHPGFRMLSAAQQRDFLAFSAFADDEHRVTGDAEEIALRLGHKCSKRLYARVSLWAKRGLVDKSRARYTLDPETRRSRFLPGSSWQLLPPQAAETLPPPADLKPETETKTETTERREEWKRANLSLDKFSAGIGVSIQGHGRHLICEALLENRDGVNRLWEEKAKFGKTNPVGLLIRLIKDGEHLVPEPPEPEYISYDEFSDDFKAEHDGRYPNENRPDDRAWIEHWIAIRREHEQNA